MPSHRKPSRPLTTSMPSWPRHERIPLAPAAGVDRVALWLLGAAALLGAGAVFAAFWAVATW